MIQIHVSGALVYDSRLGHNLLALSYTEGLNKAGTATITLPAGHPAYDAFSPYKPVVEIYDDGALVFRGRALKPQDNMLNHRTVTCEGERCFFNDAVIRPYLYQDAPEAIFEDLVAVYNSQVEADKRFVVGTVTVTDPNGYVRIESSKAEQADAVIDKIVKRCGGYIEFTTNADGARVVNWYAQVNYSNNQTIDFGSNLIDFGRASENKDIATRLIPYGAKDETTGEPITIESVNNGLDYVEDTEAIERWGVITKPVYWDDVTLPENLLRKANEELASRKNLITSLTLTAVDLSAVDKKYDSFRKGDLIRVVSRPHGLDDSFLLTDRNVNLLNKGGSNISLGKEVQTLTGLHSAGEKNSQSGIDEVERNIRAEYQLNLAKAISAAERKLQSLIEQTEESIRMEVSETYVTDGEVTSAISTEIEQLSDSVTFTFNELKTYVDDNDATARKHIEEQEKYIRFANGEITLGQTVEGSMTLTFENDLIVFKKNGNKFGWWDGVDFHTGNIVIEVNERAQLGKFAAVPRKNGHLSWLKVK